MCTMRTWPFGLVLACVCAALAPAASGAAAATEPARLARVVDGDTIVLGSGERVRLVQIDTPEVGSGECYSRAAARDLRRLLPVGSAIALERDPRLDDRDRYGRLLRYVWHGGENVNLRLVRDGSATVWLYDREWGRYASELLAAGRAARTAKRGLWGACPYTPWDPYGPATTGPGSGAAKVAATAGLVDSGAARGGSCDPSYPGVCIPPSPPDLDCKDVPYHDFRVLPPDPHHFDGNHDGRGCSSS